MFKRNSVKWIALFTAVIIVVLLPLSVLKKEKASASVSSKADALTTSFSTNEGDYSGYINTYKDTVSSYQKVSINVNNCDDSENATLEAEYKGKQNVLLTSESGFAQWRVSIPETGMYSILIEYYADEEEINSVQRSLLIDGSSPFSQAENIEFPIIFKNETPVNHIDGQDDLRPSQIVAEEWVKTFVKDKDGYFGTALRFYLTAGEHTLKLCSLSGSMAISSIVLTSGDNAQKSYDEVLKEYSSKDILPVKGKLENGILIFEAEDAKLKSDATLYPVNDNSSAGNQPFDVSSLKINCIGGTRWQSPGQWISWDIEVPESGLYEIGFRSKQNYLRDIESIRSLYINDELQFLEAGEIAFSYDSKFQVFSVGNDEPYLFYFEKGVSTIRIEVSLGKYSNYIRELTACIEEINNANWSLLTLVGNNPDLNRDYNIDKYMPHVITTFEKQSKRLKEITQSLISLTGKEDSNIAQINELIYKLERMCDDPSEIPGMFVSFREDVSALANTVLNMKNMPLIIDYMFISEQGAELPKANPNFFVSLWNAIKKFIYSFITDYNNLSGALDTSDKEPITVWIGNGLTGGRDQAQVLNQLAVQEFTPNTGIPINLQLVPGGTILTATIAGKGPDVALQVTGEDPVNYAMRNAVVDLSELDGYSEIIKRFPEAATIQYLYKGGTYALPETISFPMMFYRKDILENLGIDMSTVKTWQDLIALLPIVQGNNMQISMQPTFSSYYMLLFQSGGELYTQNNKESALDSKAALDAFNMFMGLYTNYGMPYSYNFVTRFRTGEIPISIEDYTVYNTLKISAPEIDGQWEMCAVPGIEDSNGNINNTAAIGGTGSIILSSSKHIDDSWTFLKWWTEAKIQYKYGKELESVMGVGARYNTANLEAIQMLPWTKTEKTNLLSQIDNLQGVYQIPGGYMTSRNVGFAISKVYNTNADARKTLLGYIDEIDQELEIKQKEFKFE